MEGTEKKWKVPNKWLQHVQWYKEKHKCSLKAAMIGAKESYQLYNKYQHLLLKPDHELRRTLPLMSKLEAQDILKLDAFQPYHYMLDQS